MRGYGRDFGSGGPQGRGRYDAHFGGHSPMNHEYSPYDAGFGSGGEGGMGRHRGHPVDRSAMDARSRQEREEQRFQQERAAPGEDLGWGSVDVYGDHREEPGFGRRLAPQDWQPRATPTAGDLMTENPEAVTPGTSLAEAAKTMRDLNVGILPVVDDQQNRRLLGVITDRDITIRAVAAGKNGTATVGECMTRDVEACHPDARVRDILHVMEREQVRRVPIVDHAGSLVGILAQADLAVDFAEGESHRELRVEGVIQRISQPARPRSRRGGRHIH